MNQQQTGKTYIQKLQTFAYASLGLPLLFFIYFYLESSVDRLSPKTEPEYFNYIFAAAFTLALYLIYLSYKNYQSKKVTAVSKADFKEKLQVYQKANNSRFIYYGISTSIITLGFFITNYQPFAALFGVMIVLFSIHNPNARKIVNELKLKGEEKSIIMTGLEIP